MDYLSLNSALAVTLVSTAVSLVLFLSMFPVKSVHANVSDKSDITGIPDHV